MSDLPLDKGTTEFKAINYNKSLNKPDFYYSKGQLYIQVHPQEKEAVQITTDEANANLAHAIAQGKSVERATEALILRKAGQEKFARAKAEGKLPAAPRKFKLFSPSKAKHREDTDPPAPATPKPTASHTVASTLAEVHPSDQGSAVNIESPGQQPGSSTAQQETLLQKITSHLGTTAKGEKSIKVFHSELLTRELTEVEKAEARASYPNQDAETAYHFFKVQEVKNNKVNFLITNGVIPRDQASNDYIVTYIGPQRGQDNSQFSDQEEQPSFDQESEDSADERESDNMNIPAEFIRKLDTVEDELARVQEKLEAHKTTPLGSQAIQLYDSRLNFLLKDFRHACKEICALDEKYDTTATKPKFRAINEAYDHAYITLQTITEELKIAQPGHRQSNNNTSPARMNLPKLTLPKFSGNWKEWLHFKDLFKITIMDQADTEVPEVQKFTYLKQCLEGDALKTIQSISLTGANFTTAWDALCAKYDNKRKLVQNYFRELDQLRPLTYASAYNLRKLYDEVTNIRGSLETLGESVQDCNSMFVRKVTDCFDPETRSLFEILVNMQLGSNSTSTMVPWQKVKEFIEGRCVALENAKPGYSRNNDPPREPRRSTNTFTSRTSTQCAFCKKDHWMTQCDKFKSASLQERRNMVKEKRLCYNCLNPNHRVLDCTSTRTCNTCGKKHHTLLHPEVQKPVAHGSKKYEKGSPGNGNFHKNHQANSEPKEQVQSNHSMKPMSTVILPTARILVEDSSRELRVYRAMLDSGSQTTFISEKAVQELGLKRKPHKIIVTGIGDSDNVSTRGYVELRIGSHMDKTFSMTIPALILNKVTGIMPTTKLPKQNWEHLEGLYLADATYYKPNQVDILLGADVYARVLEKGKRLGGQKDPVALLTSFGWVISGNACDAPHQGRIKSHLATQDEHLSTVLQKFWGVEEPPAELEKTHLTEEQAKCEKLFTETTTRAEDGKFCVKIPLKEDPPAIGKSKLIAMKRLAGTEARLSRAPELKNQYEDFLKEYEDQNHMELIKLPDPKDEEATYLPHHPIIRNTALTTKVRVVFDGSAKTENGASLNSRQLVGPLVQDDLTAILTRFRLHKVAINGDISQMYRQIWVHPDHQDLQRILWRKTPSDQIRSFKLKTVTYGTASAPWLATRCLVQIADDVKETNPRASEIIRNQFYVDDLLTGADNNQEAADIQNEVSKILQDYGFPLRKFASNEAYVIDSIKGGENHPEYLVNPETVIKTLGLKWNRESDTFGFKISIKNEAKLTKRSLLSEIASIFDPLGLAAPSIIRTKILMQQVWLHGNGWDDALPPNILTQYIQLRKTLPCLEEIKIQRWMGSLKNSTLELHGFSDASQTAYAAVVFLRVKEDNKFYTNIIASKTRVAPLKTVSLPRLELMAAVLLCQLMKHVKASLKKPEIPVYGWTDSTITLAWIHAQPSRFQTFVANRIAMIQEHISPQQWHHVKSEDNPADCASRGISPEELKNHDLWWHGPKWLQEEFTPSAPPVEDTTEEIKKIKALTAQPKPSFTELFSSYSRLVLFAAFIIRWKANYKARKMNQPQKNGPYTIEERTRAFKALCSHVQQHLLPREFKTLAKTTEKNGQDCEEEAEKIIKKSKLASLDPIFDQEFQLIRVGGRIRHSNLSYETKHPIIMPDGHFVRIYLQQLHLQSLHAGPTLLLATARQKLWIIQGKNACRQTVRKCIICSRWKAQTFQQKMGDLPASRCQGQHAFQVTGVDYAGPITLKYRKGRGVPNHKGYIALFVCFSTKAVHLEAVSDMTTEAFISTFRRFISRRGKPAHIYSDNGTNFVRAEKELRQLFQQQQHQQQVSKEAESQEIQWHFNPPLAPHMGGLWESAVKSAKHHLRRVMKEALLSYEELSTVLCQIEACLNSRPLMPLTEDATGEEILTPGHFLIGQPLNAAPNPDLSSLKENSLSRWQLCQKIMQSFWYKWSNDYLVSLQQRNKWQTSSGNAEPGQLVIIKEDNSPPGQWKLGRITEIHAGKDAKVRVATVKTNHGEFQRPIVKLIPLYIDHPGYGQGREDVESNKFGNQEIQ